MNDVVINQDRLKIILRECVEEVINEIGHRTASAPTIINMNAQNELDKGNDVFVRPNGKLGSLYKKRERSSEISYQAITKGVLDNVGCFQLSFGRLEEDKTTSPVKFTFSEVILLTDKRFVIEGKVETTRSPISVSKHKPKTIQIDYIFETQSFYEAVYCSNGTVSDRKLLKLDCAGVDGVNNVNKAKQLIHL